jgi:hypothetical protein
MESADKQMTSPITPGRWKNADEIIEKIGQVTRKIARYRLAAQELNAKFRAAKAAGKQSKLYEDADIKASKADRLENGYLQKLKRKLAEMQTSLLPNVGSADTSIPK